MSSPRPVTNIGRTPTFVAAAYVAPEATVARQAYTPWPGVTYPSCGSRFAVGNPSSRPRLSPWTTSRAIVNGAPSSSSAYSTAPPRTSPRMWLQGGAPPSTSRRGHDAGLEPPVGGEAVGVALGAVAEAEVLAHRHVRRPQPLHEHDVDELVRAQRRERRVERDDDHLLDPEPGDELGLALERRQEPRRPPRRDDRQRQRAGPDGRGRP